MQHEATDKSLYIRCELPWLLATVLDYIPPYFLDPRVGDCPRRKWVSCNKPSLKDLLRFRYNIYNLSDVISHFGHCTSRDYATQE